MSARLSRARALLARPDAWIDQTPGGYPIRIAGDRRSRIALTLDEAAFHQLIETPGLRPRPNGGWTLRSCRTVDLTSTPAGRPGMIDGERLLIEPDGRLISRHVNAGESPIAWLARRRDPSGRPWLTPAEIAAGERLRAEAQMAQAGPSLTMRWDALPRSGGGSAGRFEPSDRALAASRRVEAALIACGPRLRAFVERICIQGSSLQLAENDLGLRRRQGRPVLKQGLQALAEHYGLG